MARLVGDGCMSTKTVPVEDQEKCKQSTYHFIRVAKKLTLILKYILANVTLNPDSNT